MSVIKTCEQVFGGKVKKKGSLECLGVIRVITLKWHLKKFDGRAWVTLIWLRIVLVVGCFKEDDTLVAFISCGKMY